MCASILDLVQSCIKGKVNILNLILTDLEMVQSRAGESTDLLFPLEFHWHNPLTVQFGFHRLQPGVPFSPEWEQP